MRRSSRFAFALPVLLVGHLAIEAARSDSTSRLDTASRFDNRTDEYAERATEALEALFPRSVLERYADFRFGDLRATGSENATRCSEQVGLLVDGLRNGTVWALKMIDASSKLPSGILMGNRIDLGMYDECVATSASVVDGDEIRGRHCMYSAVARIGETEIGQTLSICLPAACDPEEIQIILDNIVETIELLVGTEIPVRAKGVTCASVETPRWTAGGIVTIVGFALLLLFLAVSTICDAFVRCSGGESSRDGRFALIRKFSVYSSALRVLSTKTTPRTLPSLQGLRFFSMCWVVLGHEFYMTAFAPTINSADFLKWVGSWDSLYIMIAPFSVDTFFTMSGFLMSYIFLKEMSTGRRFNLFGYYVHRYLRLTPALAAMLLITIFILPRIGSGALWERSVTSSATSCRSNWWPMLLYVHNYVNKKDLICLSHTWYLAAEMQLFAISPLILYPLSKRPKIGLAILGMFFVAAVVTPAKISYDNEYSSSLWAAKNVTRTVEAAAHFYMETHIRAAAWLIGIFFGYLVFAQRGSTRGAVKWMGWFSATAAFCFCIFSFKKFQEKNYSYEPVWETFYAAVSRPLWSVGVAWVIYASARGFGGPVTTILSLSIFNPFGRISYCVYLVHYTVLLMKIGSLRVPRYFTDFSLFNLFLSDFILSVVFGFVCSILFESPILILEKIVTKRPTRKRDEMKEELKDDKVENGIDNPALTSSG